jgi:hypothetical protein
LSKKIQFSCGCEQFHSGRSFGFIVINIYHGEHYTTPRITSDFTFCTLEEAVKRMTVRWTGQGHMAEKRNAKNGNQPIMLVVKFETLLLTRKIEESYVSAKGCVDVDTKNWLTIWY